MFKHKFFRVSLIFLFFVFTNVVFGKQNVYLMDDACFKLLKNMKMQGRPIAAIKDVLRHSSSHMQLITSKLAQERFHITWLEGDGPAGQTLPDLFIANLGLGVGYGLFTLDAISEGMVAAEYTGTVVADRRVSQDNSYLYNASGLMVDALHAGGAARFALHLPTSLQNYEFTRELPIATANLVPERTIDGRHVFLVATRAIGPLEQIGYDYGDDYRWQEPPFLFDTVGNIIPFTEYTPRQRTLVVLEDTDTRQGVVNAVRLNICEGLEAQLEFCTKGNATYITGGNSDGAINSVWRVSHTELRHLLDDHRRSNIVILGVPRYVHIDLETFLGSFM